MKLFLAALFFAACGGFMAWLYGPLILSDLELKNKALIPAPDAEITDARCRVRMGFLSSCDLDYKRGTETGELDYMIFGDLGEAPVMLMTDPDTPGSITSTIGVEYASNRMWTLGGFVFICGLFVLGGIVGMFKRPA
jgi:hypothetical protein